MKSSENLIDKPTVKKALGITYREGPSFVFGNGKTTHHVIGSAGTTRIQGVVVGFCVAPI